MPDIVLAAPSFGVAGPRGRARRPRARVPLGVGDEAGDRARVPRRGRGGRDRPRRARRPAGLDGAASARPRLGAAVRGGRRRSPGRASGGSTPTTASTSLGAALAEHAEMPFADYLREAVLEPLGLRARYDGRPAIGRVRLARRPARARPRAARATLVCAGDARRGDVGAVPRAGRRAARLRPAGAERLGPRLRAARRKSPHWTGAGNSPRTFGHFGRSGTFLWVDPEAGVALGCLTDLDFGDWAVDGLAGAFRRRAGRA